MDIENLLEEVNSAITAILTGAQEIRIGNRYLKRADLSMLRQMKRELELQASALNTNGLMEHTYTAVFDRR